MCVFKSGIILKDRVFVPDYDSHTDMLKELKIADTRKNAENLFVRAELLPPHNDAFAPIDEWTLNIDQDIVPEWFVKNYEEQRMKEAVKEWAKNHIHIGVNNLVIVAGAAHHIKDCKNVTVCGNATVTKVCGNATVNGVCGNATVNEVFDNATVNWVCGNATVNEVCDNATVNWVCGNATVTKVCGNATVNEVFDNATVTKVCGNATVISCSYINWLNKTDLIISDNATFKDCYSKVIWQSGTWEIKTV